MIPAELVAAAVLSLFLDVMLRAVSGRGLMFWTIAAGIACYAIAFTIRRCLTHGGWGWFANRYESELATARALFLSVPEMRRPRDPRPWSPRP